MDFTGDSFTIKAHPVETCPCDTCESVRRDKGIKEPGSQKQHGVIYRGEVCIVTDEIGTDVFVSGSLDQFLEGVYKSRQLQERKIMPQFVHDKRNRDELIREYRDDFLKAEQKRINMTCIAIVLAVVVFVETVHLVFR